MFVCSLFVFQKSFPCYYRSTGFLEKKVQQELLVFFPSFLVYPLGIKCTYHAQHSIFLPPPLIHCDTPSHSIEEWRWPLTCRTSLSILSCSLPLVFVAKPLGTQVQVTVNQLLSSLRHQTGLRQYGGCFL